MRSPWRGTTASSRASRSGRSPTVSVALRRRSRRTSTTPPARRRGRSRRATSASVGAALRTPRRATARATPTRTARPATLARPCGCGRATACSRRCARGASSGGRPPTSYDWTRTHARRRGGEALARLATGEWPAAQPRHPAVRHVVHRSRGGCEAGRPDVDDGVVGGVLAIWQGIDFPAETPGIDRYIRGSEGR